MRQKPREAGAEGMSNVSRRKFIAGSAAIAAAGSAATTAVEAAEQPARRISRLGWELATALNDYDDGRWDAHIQPAKHGELVVAFKSRSASWWVENVPTLQLRNAVAAHEKALRALHIAIDAEHQQRTKAASFRLARAGREETKALHAICNHKAWSKPDPTLKARYLTKLVRRGILDDKSLGLILKSEIWS